MMLTLQVSLERGAQVLLGISCHIQALLPGTNAGISVNNNSLALTQDVATQLLTDIASINFYDTQTNEDFESLKLLLNSVKEGKKIIADLNLDGKKENLMDDKVLGEDEIRELAVDGSKDASNIASRILAESSINQNCKTNKPYTITHCLSESRETAKSTVLSDLEVCIDSIEPTDQITREDIDATKKDLQLLRQTSPGSNEIYKKPIKNELMQAIQEEYLKISLERIVDIDTRQGDFAEYFKKIINSSGCYSTPRMATTYGQLIDKLMSGDIEQIARGAIKF